MEATLLLNTSYEALQVISWQRAVTLLFQGKVEVVETHDKDLHSVSVTFKMPSVVRLLQMVGFSRHRMYAKFSRANLFERDKHQCQYCGDKLSSHDLTFDHVIPSSQGGAKTWENIVSACLECNAKKANRSLREAGMRLLNKPMRPKVSQVTLTISRMPIPKCWADYLYWTVKLE